MSFGVNGLYTPIFAYSLGPGAGTFSLGTATTYNQAVGNLIVVAITAYDGSAIWSTIAVHDTAGNTYLPLTRFAVGVNRTVQFFYAKNCLGSAVNQPAVYFTLGAGAYQFFITIMAWDISGADLVSPSCGEAMGWQTPSGGTLSTGQGAGSSNLTTTKTNSVILAMAVQADFGTTGARSAAGGFTQDDTDWGGGYDDLWAGHLFETSLQSGLVVTVNTTATFVAGLIVAEAFASATQPAASTNTNQLMLVGCGT